MPPPTTASGPINCGSELVDWAKGQLAGSAPAGEPAPFFDRSAASQSLLDLPLPDAPRPPLELVSLGRRWQPVGLAEEEDEEPAELARWEAAGQPGDPAGTASLGDAAAPLSHGLGGRVAALQIHNRYLITESEEGVVVIDQHALHERILYEQLREQCWPGRCESQNLLVPEPVDLSPAEAAAALEHRDVLAQLGVVVEPFGGDTVLVSSYPAMLANLNLAEILRALVDRLLVGGDSVGGDAEGGPAAGSAEPTKRDVLDELLHMISCKAAIKAGDRLTPEEIAALVEQRHLAQDSPPLPPRPPDRAGLHPRGAGPTVQAEGVTPFSSRRLGIAIHRLRRLAQILDGQEMIVKRVVGLRIRIGGESHSGWLPPNAAQPLPTPTRRRRHRRRDPGGPVRLPALLRRERRVVCMGQLVRIARRGGTRCRKPVWDNPRAMDFGLGPNQSPGVRRRRAKTGRCLARLSGLI